MESIGNSDAGSLIRELRERAGMTQAELARKLACGQPYVNSLESSPVIKTSTVQRVLGILGYDIIYTAVSRQKLCQETTLSWPVAMKPLQLQACLGSASTSFTIRARCLSLSLAFAAASSGMQKTSGNGLASGAECLEGHWSE